MLNTFNYFCFIHSSVDRHLGCFHFLAIVNSAAMNIHIQVFNTCFNSLLYILKSGIARSSANSFIIIIMTVPHDLWDLSSPARDGNRILSSKSAES